MQIKMLIITLMCFKGSCLLNAVEKCDKDRILNGHDFQCTIDDVIVIVNGNTIMFNGFKPNAKLDGAHFPSFMNDAHSCIMNNFSVYGKYKKMRCKHVTLRNLHWNVKKEEIFTTESLYIFNSSFEGVEPLHQLEYLFSVRNRATFIQTTFKNLFEFKNLLVDVDHAINISNCHFINNRNFESLFYPRYCGINFIEKTLFHGNINFDHIIAVVLGSQTLQLGPVTLKLSSNTYKHNLAKQLIKFNWIFVNSVKFTDNRYLKNAITTIMHLENIFNAKPIPVTICNEIYAGNIFRNYFKFSLRRNEEFLKLNIENSRMEVNYLMNVENCKLISLSNNILLQVQNLTLVACDDHLAEKMKKCFANYSTVVAKSQLPQLKTCTNPKDKYGKVIFIAFLTTIIVALMNALIGHNKEFKNKSTQTWEPIDFKKLKKPLEKKVISPMTIYDEISMDGLLQRNTEK